MMRRWFLVGLFLWTFLAFGGNVFAEAVLSITADKTSFFVGEPIVVTMRLCNHTTGSIVLQFVREGSTDEPIVYRVQRVGNEQGECAQEKYAAVYQPATDDWLLPLPGRYLLRAIATGGQLAESNELLLTVTQPTGQQAEALQFLTRERLQAVLTAEQIDDAAQKKFEQFLRQFGETQYAAAIRQALRQHGKGPRLTIMPNERLDLGEAAIGEQGRLPLLIKNTGTEALDITKLDLPPAPFSFIGVPAAPLSLQPNEWREIEVVFRPEEPGQFSGTMTITSNDLTLPMQTLELSGKSPGRKPINWWLWGLTTFVVAGIAAAWHKKAVTLVK